MYKIRCPLTKQIQKYVSKKKYMLFISCSSQAIIALISSYQSWELWPLLGPSTSPKLLQSLDSSIYGPCCSHRCLQFPPWNICSHRVRCLSKPPVVQSEERNRTPSPFTFPRRPFVMSMLIQLFFLLHVT